MTNYKQPYQQDIYVALLRSFNAAHDLILAQGGHLTTLCAGTYKKWSDLLD